MVIVSSMQKKNKRIRADWNVFCFSLFQNLLRNDLMSNNVLLKLRNNVWIPKLTVMGKVTLKSNPETYKL